jgi:hypothetical protein
MNAGMLRHAAALAHAVGGVALDLVTVAGVSHRVAAGCLGAATTPCQLRRWIIATPPAKLNAFSADLARIEVRGMVDLGGGLYQRAAAGPDERWYTTSLGADAVVALLDAHPESVADPGVSVRLLPDPCLGVTVACVTAPHPAAARLLDEGAARAFAACLAQELVASAAQAAR